MAIETKHSMAWIAASLACALVAAPALRADEDVPATARALHLRTLTLDSHLDTPAQFDDPSWDILARHGGDSQVDYPRMVEGGLDGGLWAIYTPQKGRTADDDREARDHGLRRLIGIRQLLAAHPDKFELALVPEDAARIKKAGKRVVYISMENAAPLGTDPASLLHFYYGEGLRVLGLVHTSNNRFADSSTDAPEWHGLSPEGKALVAEANRLGILIDQSHASDEVFDQLIELSKAPILLSHTSSKALHDHPRNLDDERIRKLAAHGGVIQVNSLGFYIADTGETPAVRQELRALYERYEALPHDAAHEQALAAEREALVTKYHVKRATLDDYLAHLQHILQVAGPEHVGLGADWDGGGGVVGLEDVSQLPKITAWLVKEGYSEQQIAGIWGGNLLRVLGEAQRVGRELSAAGSR